jgi:hypothetical protein
MNIMYPAGVAGVTIAELQPTTRISLRLADPAASGIGLPVQVGSRSVDGTRTALCLAPTSGSSRCRKQAATGCSRRSPEPRSR